MVLARVANTEHVVFGTIMSGRAQGGQGADQVLGMSINTLPIRIDIDQRGVESVARDTHRLLGLLLRHEHAPLSLAQRCSQVPAQIPLFSALFNYRHSLAIGGLGQRESSHAQKSNIWGEERSNYPLTLSVDDWGDAFTFTAQVSKTIASGRVCELMTTAIIRLLAALADAPESPASSVDVMSIRERQCVLTTWNATSERYPEARCFHELFEAQVQRAPDAAALVHSAGTLSYAELNARANKLACALRRERVAPNTRVAICAERGPDLVVAVLATLKAGGAYVPLDPNYPAERLVFMIRDSGAVLLLADAVGRAALGDLDTVTCVELERHAAWANESSADLSSSEIGPAPNDVAYVIYTSGSTGVPKGVLNEHRGLCNLARLPLLNILPESRVLQFASFSFDASVWELAMALTNGASLHLAPRSELLPGPPLLKTLQSRGISHLLLPPSALAVCDDPDLPFCASTLIVGGEAVSLEEANKWSARLDLINAYGPTEATVCTTVCRLTPGANVVPLGRAIPNARVYVLDARGRPAPVNVTGEIHVAGAGVARGYLRRDELTAERFVRDPFVDDEQARMYKTGDLGRWLADGSVEFLGRNDQQIKLRGFRIELGEVEARLGSITGVTQVVVLARGDSPGDMRLVAYFTSDSPLDIDALRSHARLGLPEYMVPTAYVQLDSFPLTASGKVDRRALPSPRLAEAHSGLDAPQSELEAQLAEIWCELLGVTQVGRNHDFFELGGHSLSAVTLIERMRRVGLHADVSALFAAPTVAKLAQVVVRHDYLEEVPENRIPSEASFITPDMLPLIALDQPAIDNIVAQIVGGAASIQDIYPLAPLQEGILFHHLMQREGDGYVLPLLLGFASRERLERFVDTLQLVVARHDILRTAIVWEGLDRPVQVVLRSSRLPIELIALNPEVGDVGAQLRARYEPRSYRMAMHRAPLLHGYVAEDAPNGRWLLLLLAHHVVLDHGTLERLVEEVAWIEQGRGSELSAPIPFRNFVARARSGFDSVRHEAFFSKLLGDVTEPTAPFGLLDVRGDGTNVVQATQALSLELSRGAREQARASGVSAAALMHLAWALVVARASGRTDVVFGTVMLGRMRGGERIEHALGLFINTLPMRISIGKQSVSEGLRSAHDLLSELIRHEHAPLALAQRCSGVSSHAPLFSSLFNYRHSRVTAQSELQARDIDSEVQELGGEERTNYPVTLSVDDTGDGFSLTAQVSASVTAERVCGLMARAVEQLILALRDFPERALEDVDVLPKSERSLLESWNATACAYPAEACLHELIEQQVAVSPEAVAVSSAEERVSYAELNERANRLAAHLRSLGVGPESRLAVCMNRSVELVVALLAVLKAGGAFVPVDPSYPRERVALLLSDCAPSQVLVDESYRRILGDRAPTANVVDVTVDAWQWATQGSENVPRAEQGLSARNLAYIIYTSGSTGLPKGAMNEHRGVVNRLVWMQRRYGLTGSDVVLQKTPCSFDVSVWELFWPLIAGAQLRLAEPDRHKDASYLRELITTAKVSTLHFVPSMLQSFLDSLADAPAERSLLPTLSRVICSGETLSPALVRRFWTLLPGVELHNLYGPTEAAVDVTAWQCREADDRATIPIGRPISNTRIYVLDERGEPTPVGVSGELWIGGVQVGRGYWQRPELSAERFVPDPWSADPDGRMYRTGDVARWSPDGLLEYQGRRDFQVKIRGVRVELGEVEARLSTLGGVREVVVLAREDEPGDVRLVAYYVGADELTVEVLRAHARSGLPEQLVPAAYVMLRELPLTPNGKLDRRALPAPDGDAYGARHYEAPRGEIEERLSHIWSDLLKLSQVGRNDHFFELGGHSLLAMTLVARMQRAGMACDVQQLFTTPVLHELAARVTSVRPGFSVPPNLIRPDSTSITPDLLPLIDIGQEAIDRIVAQVPGGVSNVQDIYPLSPLQEGILFHHLLGRAGDAYLLPSLLGFRSRERLQRFVATLQQVIDRHDILRTGIFWEAIEEPVQVVLRRATLVVEEVAFDPLAGDIAEQLKAKYDSRHYRLDVSRAPLLRAFYGFDPGTGRWLLMVVAHHLVIDHSTLELLVEETRLIERGLAAQLPTPVPFRTFVARARSLVSREEHELFFRKLLGEVDAPTAPFGLLEVQGDGSSAGEARLLLDRELSRTLRALSRKAGVSAATLLHLAWAMVLAKVSDRQDVVFGTVLFGRLQAGESADRALGLFINTLPVKIDVREQSVATALSATQALLTQLIGHEHAPLSLAQRCSLVPAQTPLFSSLLNYRHSARASAATRIVEQATDSDDEVAELWGEERTNYPLVLSIDDLGDDFALTSQVSAPVAPERICELMVSAIAGLCHALELTPELPLASVPVLPESDRRQLAAWGATESEFPSESCVHELIELQVERTPNAIALWFDDASLTYQELNSRANQLAWYLRELGVGPDSRVAVCVDRSLQLVVALLAIFKAGGAYVPIDPGNPAERLAYLLDDCEPALLIVHAASRPAASHAPTGLGVLDLDDDAALWANAPLGDSRAPGLTSRHLAYVIYTSGSTGKPKGAMNEHRSVVNRLVWMQRSYGLGPNDVFLQKTPITFDISVWELFCPLLSGSTLVIARPEGHKDAAYLHALFRTRGINIVHFVPAMLQSFLEHEVAPNFPELSRVLSGGEALPASLARRFHEQLPGVALHNLYGPTEAAIEVTFWNCMPGDQGNSVPIGRPIANCRLHVLDAQGALAPIGVVGELYIAGVQVGRGYWKRPELTAERFVRDPFVADPSARMYKTGDLARWSVDGVLEYLGRNDFQVKIRGFRVELGEIEEHIRVSTGVSEVVVLAREDEPGNQRLVAYYQAPEALNTEGLREQLRKALPDYMLPSGYVRMSAFPLLPNGKLDRKALPAPGRSDTNVPIYEPARGELEQRVAQLWAELLLVQVGRHDNFFDLGGHSLSAVRLISRVRHAFQVKVMLADLFAEPTLCGFAARVARTVETQDQLPLVPVERTAELPLSLAQQRLWFLAQFAGASRAYQVPIHLRLQGPLNRSALSHALNCILARHEALRTRFVVREGQPTQVIEPMVGGWPIEEHDLRNCSDKELAVLGLLETAVNFDVERGPLISAKLVELADDDHVLLVSMHHLVTDGWSTGIFLTELSALYRAHGDAVAAALPELTVQYADFAVWQRNSLTTAELKQQADYWRGALADAPALLELPSDRPRPAQQSYEGGALPFLLDRVSCESVRELARRHGCTLYMVLLAAWGATLARISGQPQVVIGSPVAGRARVEIEPLLGCFINTLAQRVDLSGDLSVAALLHRTKAEVLAAHAHQDLPFERVVEALQPRRSLSHTPIFQVMFSWQNAPVDSFSLPGLQVSTLGAPPTSAQFDLTLELAELNGEIRGGLTFASALFDATTIERYLSYFANVLRAMVSDDSRLVSRLPLVSESELQRVLCDWNQTRVDFRQAPTVHGLFESQVRRTPDAIALRFGEQQLTYGELDAQANRLASELLGFGVEPEARVAICLERGPQLLVALLAVLKAGGAYVPLDPTYPSERLAFMLHDSAPMVAIVDRAGRAALDFEHSARIVDLDTERTLETAFRELVHTSSGANAEHAAYLIYTSGSTGQPKGVCVTHGSAVNFLCSMAREPGLQASDVLLAVTTLSFDIAVLELFLPLAVGACVVVATRAEAREGAQLLRAIERYGVTTLQATPSTWRLLLAAGFVGGPSFTALCGGEALAPDLAQQLIGRAGQVWNMYGPTETTVWSTCQRLNAADTAVSIGRPIANTTAYVLDEYLQPRPIGSLGELYIGGAGVARGYHARPALSAERFIVDPFSAGPDARLYRTGDLARWTADGRLECVGRADFQVKVRGFRIELGEIEARLREIPGVRDAVVVAREVEAGDTRLVAYYADESAPTPELLRARLQGALPEFMVPAAYSKLAALPRLANGKLDRSQLLAPDRVAYSARPYEPPQGELEQTLATIWSELLGIERVGRYDHFFELGGHSLLAVQLISRIRGALRLELPLETLFAHPELIRLAAQLSTASGSDPQPIPILARRRSR